jgi:hypothetical protein
VQKLVFEIHRALHELKSEIIPIHLRRTDERLVVADGLSKTLDSDDWSIDAMSFAWIDNEFKFEVDVFASGLNTRTTRFFSEFYHEQTSGIS